MAQVGSEAGKAGTIREGHLSLPGVSTGLEQDQGRGLQTEGHRCAWPPALHLWPAQPAAGPPWGLQRLLLFIT